MTELKPCPFCGGEGVIAHEQFVLSESSYVKCKGCGSRIGGISISTRYCADEKAIAAWNRRTEQYKEKS